MARYNVLITVPYDLDIREEGALPNDVLWELSELNTWWPSLVTPGTGTIAPDKLMHTIVHTDEEDVETLFGILLVAYDLSWVIKHNQTFGADEPIYDGDDIIGYQARVITQGVFDDIKPYIHPRYSDEAQTIEIPKESSWFHRLAGQADWRF